MSEPFAVVVRDDDPPPESEWTLEIEARMRVGDYRHNEREAAVADAAALNAAVAARERAAAVRALREAADAFCLWDHDTSTEATAWLRARAEAIERGETP